jgi:hypothetical protein
LALLSGLHHSPRAARDSTLAPKGRLLQGVDIGEQLHCADSRALRFFGRSYFCDVASTCFFAFATAPATVDAGLFSMIFVVGSPYDEIKELGRKPIKVDAARCQALALHVRAELERIFALCEKFTPGS